MIDVTLDTTVIIDLIRADAGARDLVERFIQPAASHVVFGELLLGGMKSEDPLEKLRVFRAFEGITVLQADASTASIYAHIRWQLERSGFPIPQNDIWIAAASIQAKLPLITRDLHFKRVADLQILAY